MKDFRACEVLSPGLRNKRGAATCHALASGRQQIVLKLHQAARHRIHEILQARCPAMVSSHTDFSRIRNRTSCQCCKPQLGSQNKRQQRLPCATSTQPTEGGGAGKP